MEIRKVKPEDFVFVAELMGELGYPATALQVSICRESRDQSSCRAYLLCQSSTFEWRRHCGARDQFGRSFKGSSIGNRSQAYGIHRRARKVSGRRKYGVDHSPPSHGSPSFLSQNWLQGNFQKIYKKTQLKGLVK